jgi:hypothetical protein
MATFQVTCIKKQYGTHSNEGITHLGGPVMGELTRQEVVDRIEGAYGQKDTFYTRVNGRVADIGVVREPGKLPYLRTHADGYWNDNLLALGQCA